MPLRRILSLSKKWMLERCNLLLRALFSRMPVRNRVFFYTIRADGRLLENSRCVYDALEGVERVVVAKMLPHPVWIKPKIYYYLLTSRVIVTDDYLRYLRHTTLREEQKVVQIWHACGAFKRFGLDAPSLLSPQEERRTHSQYAAVCVSAEQVRPFYAQAFGIPQERVQALGTPRTDRLLDEPARRAQREALFRRRPELQGKRLYLYAPTFRERDGRPCFYDPQLDWEALDNALEEDEVLIIRRHPIMKEPFWSGKTFRHILDCTDEPTPALLTAASLLVTDYSSVIFDAILCGVPLVFYCPDFSSYERDFYLAYPQDLPGPVVYRGEELLPAMRAVCQTPPLEALESFRSMQLGACDGHASERVAGLVRSYLDAGRGR